MPVTGKLFWILVLISVAGGVAGSQLLLHTPSERFARIVPYLMIGASLVFSFSNQLRSFASRHSSDKANAGLLYAGTLAISIYGGYFGAGMGVLMIVLFLIAANIGVQQSAGLRMWCATGVNTLAVTAFIVKGIVVWRVAIPMLICTLIGGYWGAHAVQTTDRGDGAERRAGVRLDHELVVAGAIVEVRVTRQSLESAWNFW